MAPENCIAQTDDEFDVVFAEPWRSRSGRFWSPFAVAALAARWLTETGITTVLDVGSGVGKFCLVGALTTRARFVGVEQRGALVAAAQRAAERLGVQERATFIHAEATPALLADFGALYLFNPFTENLYPPTSRLDSSVELSKNRFRRDIFTVERTLDGLPPGARVATYHGFGGHVPDSFDIHHERPIGSDVLRLWVKSARVRKGYYVETELGVVRGRPYPPDLASE